MTFVNRGRRSVGSRVLAATVEAKLTLTIT